MPSRILVVDDSPTIRKVVAALLERHGFEAVVAADGQVALRKLVEATKANGADKNGASRIDLVLLDFVMPRMNGFQFCRALRQNEALKTTPVVLMSAKSDKIREYFVQQTGAIDAITKPFDAQALIAVIENAIRRAEAWRARGEALAAGIPDDFEAAESIRPTLSDADSRRVLVVLDFVRKLSATLAPVLAKLPSGAVGSEGQIATEIATNVTPDALKELGEQLRALDFGGSPKIALTGDISVIPIGAILQLLQIEAQTGILLVTDGKSEVTIAIRAGLIDLVQARNVGEEFRLGRYFVEHGLVTPGDIDAILRDQSGAPPPSSTPGKRLADTVPPTSRGPKYPMPAPSAAVTFAWREESSVSRKLLGNLLVDSGRITPDQLRDALARQSSELIYELLRWQKGRFEFRREALASLAQSAKLGLPVASVVMEGFRRVDEWRLVEAGLGSFEAVLQADAVAIEALGADRLARQERRVLDVVDGERTVREIIQLSHMSPFDACKILFQLLEARLVRRRAA
jgi:DNA-binding response OmpR family regulator